MSYRNILNVQMNEYNRIYKRMCKDHPSFSIERKQKLTLGEMLLNRGINTADLLTITTRPFTSAFNYCFEVVGVNYDMIIGIERFYLKDDSLFDFFKNTEVRQKEVQSILDTLDSTENGEFWGVIGKNYSFTMCYVKVYGDKHFILVYTDDMNYCFCVEDYDSKVNDNKCVFNMAANFLFYINAFPECVIDGVPAGVKRNPKTKSIGVSEKIVSHTSVEHGFVRAHFRSGYFRHLNSDYFVNCKGQIRFIQSTMVKGRAKTVLSKEEN